MRTAVIAAALCFSIVGLSTAAEVAAAMKRPTNIPAQSLRPALQLLSKERDFQIVFRTDVVGELKTSGASGDLTLDEALTQLLRETDLTYRFLDANTVTIVRVAQTAPASSSGPAPSSEAPAEKRAHLEEVTVTGSRVQRDEREGAQPVNLYTREAVQKSGQVTLNGYLNSLPEFGPTYTGAMVNGSYAGNSTVQLRGLPAGSTLVLINGRRPPPSGFTNGTFFNLDNIPTAAVERVEVLPQGSSAVYGSDALAGVVNIILRDSFQGVDASVRYGTSSGADTVMASISGGFQGDRFRGMFVSSYSSSDGLTMSERPLTADADFRRFGSIDRRVPRCTPGNVHSTSGGNLPGLSGPSAAITASRDATAIGDFTVGATNLCNRFADAGMTSPTDSYSLLGAATYALTDRTELFAEVLASYTDVAVPLGKKALTRVRVPASNAFNPFGTDVFVDAMFRGYRADDVRRVVSRFARPLVGARGGVGDWSWEAAGWSGKEHASQDRDANTDPIALARALASSDPAAALNLFTTGPSASPQVLDALLVNSHTGYDTTTRVISGIVRGPLLSLPAGAINIAAGVELSSEELSQDFPPASAQFSTELSRDTRAMFAEARVPLLSATDPQGAYSALAASLAVRYDRYSDFGSATTPQYGLEWRPNRDLLVRAAYGKTFKAPTIFSFGYAQYTTASGIAFYVDPKRNGESVSPELVYGGNPNVTPEKGESLSAGLVWSNSRFEGLETSLTWWNIKIDNRLSLFPSVQTLINNEDVIPGRIVRGPSANGQPGRIVQANYTALNLGELDVSGVDAKLSRAFDTPAGDVRLSVAGTYTYEYDAVLAPAAATSDYLSNANTDVWTPRWRGNVAARWSRGPLSAAITGRYVGKYRDYRPLESTGRYLMLGNFWRADLNAEIQVGRLTGWQSSALSELTASVGAVDLFDQGATFSTYSTSGYDPGQYDIRGRQVYLQLQTRF